MITDRQEQMPVKKNTSAIKIGNMLQNINSQLSNHKFSQQAVELVFSRDPIVSNRKRINTDRSEEKNNGGEQSGQYKQMKVDEGEYDYEQYQEGQREGLDQSREQQHQQQIKSQESYSSQFYQPHQQPQPPFQPVTTITQQQQVFPSDKQQKFLSNSLQTPSQNQQNPLTKVPSSFFGQQPKQFNNIAYTYNQMQESLVSSSRQLLNEEVEGTGNVSSEGKQERNKRESRRKQWFGGSKVEEKGEQSKDKYKIGENVIQVKTEDKPMQANNIQSNQSIQPIHPKVLTSPRLQHNTQQPNPISQTHPNPQQPHQPLQQPFCYNSPTQPKKTTVTKTLINQINSSQSISYPSQQLMKPNTQTKNNKIDDTLPQISNNKSQKQNREPLGQTTQNNEKIVKIEPVIVSVQSQVITQPHQQPNPLLQQQQKQLPLDSSPQHQPSQYSQTQQPQPTFHLSTYQAVQPLLQNLLTQLKSYLKMVKNDQLLRVKSKINQQQGSKFFYNKGNRRELSSEAKSKNKSLMDILERRNNVGRVQNHVNEFNSQNKNSNKPVAVSTNITKLSKVPLGLGNFDHDQQPYLRTQYPNNPNLNSNNNQSGASSRLQSEAEEKQKLIRNREKINQILASSMANFKQGNEDNREKKSKSGAFFIRSNQRSRSINKAQHQPSHHNQASQFTQGNGLSNPIPRSTNLTNLTRHKAISTTQMPSHKTTIQPLSQNPSGSSKPLTLTTLLKPIRQYLQLISTGQVDEIQLFLQQASQANQEFLVGGNLSEMITRKRLFKTAMYFQRAVVVAGVGYGYLMVTAERGVLRYHVQRGSRKKQKQEDLEILQRNKEQTQLILKYMINLVSFALNNTKLITNTITTHFLSNPTKPTAIHKQLLKRNLQTIKLNLQYINQTFLKLFSQTQPLCQSLNINEDFGESFKNITKLITKQSIQESFYTLLEYFAFYLALTQRQRAIPFLSVAPNPYLDQTERYTLVVDFVSVFCQGSSYSKKLVFRPYAQHFLSQMSRYYEIVLYCNALPQEIDKVVDLLDGYRKIQGKQSKVIGNNMSEEKIVTHRLYKYHMVEEKLTGKMVKKLQRIGRDLEKVIMIDSQQNRIIGQDSNIIFVKQWRGSKNDATLAELCSVLISISVQGLNCTKAAERIDQQMRINLQNGIRHINFGLNLKQDLMQSQMDSGQGYQNLQ